MDTPVNLEPGCTRPAATSYEPLGENQFRLIHLHAGQRGDDLKFDIVRHTLELGELPFYEAISYAWGSAEPTERVECSGQVCFITKSARDALWRFRFTDRARYEIHHH